MSETQSALSRFVDHDVIMRDALNRINDSDRFATVGCVPDPFTSFMNVTMSRTLSFLSSIKFCIHTSLRRSTATCNYAIFFAKTKPFSQFIKIAFDSLHAYDIEFVRLGRIVDSVPRSFIKTKLLSRKHQNCGDAFASFASVD